MDNVNRDTQFQAEAKNILHSLLNCKALETVKQNEQEFMQSKNAAEVEQVLAQCLFDFYDSLVKAGENGKAHTTATVAATPARNTQFAGFAKLVWQEMSKNLKFLNFTIEQRSSIDEVQQEVIAQRAYDLVLHTAWSFAPVDLERLSMGEVVAKVPDISQWLESDS